MENSNKKEFWSIINVTMELMNRPPLSKEAIITWWNILEKYDIADVRSALDKWVDTSIKSPTPHDIKEILQHKVTIYARLPSPLTKQANKQYAKEVVDFVAAQPKPDKDYKQWARDLISGKKISNHPEIAIPIAKAALA
jgi:hypothetical protein